MHKFKHKIQCRKYTETIARSKIRCTSMFIEHQQSQQAKQFLYFRFLVYQMAGIYH